MKMENFEDILTKMTRPEVTHLKHQDMLANAITKAKDKSVINWWWLSIPLYLIATLLMKTIFMPQSTLRLNIHDFTSREIYSSVLFFLVLPILFIVINFISIRNIYFLSGSPKSISFLRTAWFNVLMVIFSILILIIYSL
jgi:hypothetical protein